MNFLLASIAIYWISVARADLEWQNYRWEFEWDLAFYYWDFQRTQKIGPVYFSPYQHRVICSWSTSVSVTFTLCYFWVLFCLVWHWFCLRSIKMSSLLNLLDDYFIWMTLWQMVQFKLKLKGILAIWWISSIVHYTYYILESGSRHTVSSVIITAMECYVIPCMPL